MAVRSLVYKSNRGVYITSISTYYKLETIRLERDYGSLYLDLPLIYPVGYFTKWNVLEVWKSVPGTTVTLEGGTCYFIMSVEYKVDESGKLVIHILAYDANFILNTRINAYHSNNAKSKLTMRPDDMLKEIVRNNFTTGVEDAARSISTYLTVADNDSLGSADITETFAWQEVLPELKQICKRSELENGQYLSYDISYDPTTFRFTFDTYIGHRGVDRGSTSNTPFLLSVTRKNLSYASYTVNSSEAVTCVYAGGQGYEENRVIKVAKNDAQIAISPFARVEDFYNATETDDPNNVLSAAQGWLASHGDRMLLNGHISQTPGSIYNIHYLFGDIVVAKFMIFSIDVHLDKIHITDNYSSDSVEIYARNAGENAF